MAPLPIDKNKIVVVSFYGRGYSDSPKAITDKLIKTSSDYKIIWALNDDYDNSGLPTNIARVKYGRIRYIYHMSTAKLWIDNCRKQSFVRKKMEQKYIQTWHGLPNKKIEKDVEEMLDLSYVKSAIHDSNICDLMVSNSEFLTKIYKTSFWYDGEILECGYPRNDILLQSDTARAKSIREIIRTPNNYKVVLYAPTFRSDYNMEVYDLDYEKLTSTLKSKFGNDWAVLVRLHPNIAAKSDQLDLDHSNVYDVTSYPDMQELLMVSDVLITDYSSSIFDYIITKKPCFMYANDLEDYKKDRDLYIDFKDLPFSFSETNDQLADAIMNYDAKVGVKKAEAFMNKFGYKEHGDASAKVAQWIIEKTRVKNKQ